MNVGDLIVALVFTWVVSELFTQRYYVSAAVMLAVAIGVMNSLAHV